MIHILLMTTILLVQSAWSQGSSDLIPASSTQTMIQEFDLELKEWREGKEISISHPYFLLRNVRAENTDTIVFQGESRGKAGQIFLQFYTLSGSLIPVPPEKQMIAHVDQKNRLFQVASKIPAELTGKTGAVQVTFQGEKQKRAAFLLKVSF